MELIYLGQLITVAIGAFLAGWWFKRGQFENKMLDTNKQVIEGYTVFDNTIAEIFEDMKQEILNSKIERDESLKQQQATTKIIETVKGELVAIKKAQKEMSKAKRKKDDVKKDEEPDFIKGDSDNETD